MTVWKRSIGYLQVLAVKMFGILKPLLIAYLKQVVPIVEQIAVQAVHAVATDPSLVDAGWHEKLKAAVDFIHPQARGCGRKN